MMDAMVSVRNKIHFGHSLELTGQSSSSENPQHTFSWRDKNYTCINPCPAE